MSREIVLASGNAGKLAEIQALAEGLPWKIVPQSQYGIGDIEETGLTFIENAILKARHAAQIAECGAIADDSGLEVAVLGGAPGIYSARYAGTPSDDAANNARLLNELRHFSGEDRAANFHCVMVYLSHAGDPAPLIAEGVWHGTILTEMRGSNGFGYDPLFFDPSRSATGAELELAVKNRISHRGQALRKLLERLHKLNAGV